LHFAKRVRILTVMSEQGAGSSDEAAGSGSDEAANESNDRKASEDLAEGLDLMLRAAKKAMRHVDPANMEKLGRRALESIEHLRRERVEEIGRKARQRLDTKRVEEIAEEAGRELLRVVERVAERVDAVVNPSSSRPPKATSEAAADPPASDEGQAPRVRVEE
jgi:hypothetical protein